MQTRLLALIAALSTTLVSSTAFAWSAPIHKWCLELNAYDDCNHYYSIEKKIEGVDCYDIV